MNFEFDHVGELLRVGVEVARLDWIVSCWGLKGEKLACMLMSVVGDGVGWMIVVIVTLYFYTVWE